MTVTTDKAGSSTQWASPVGPLTLVADADGRLCRLEFGDRAASVAAAPGAAADQTRPDGVLADAIRQLEEYFAGTRREFALDLAPRGTAFQLAVWNALLTIPFGSTASYGEIAREVGSPNAVRAVGQANGRNPLAIVVPCHRVIGSDHSLTGYGGGLDRKRFLLALEGAPITPSLDL